MLLGAFFETKFSIIILSYRQPLNIILNVTGVDTVKSLRLSMRSLDQALRKQNLFWLERSASFDSSILIVFLFYCCLGYLYYFFFFIFLVHYVWALVANIGIIKCCSWVFYMNSCFYLCCWLEAYFSLIQLSLSFIDAFLIYYLLMWCRWTVMSIRVYAANMGFLDTQQFSGFLKDLWNPKSENH